MNRISVEEYYMNIAIQVSLRSTCIRRRVGSVIVKDNRIISTGYNGAPSGMKNCVDCPNRCYRSAHNIPSGSDLHLCYAIHSEQNAIMSALRTGEDLHGASIYITTFPCSTCAKLIIQSGISNVYYIDDYNDKFTKHMLEEVGLSLHAMDGSIYRTPVGTSEKTVNDLDTIDPLVAAIYKYEPGTPEFAENRDKVFREHGIYEKYNELIYYTDFKMDKEIIDVEEVDFSNFRVGIDNRNNLEYNGDSVKQLVVGGLVFDVSKGDFYVLKCKGERLKDKLTLIQGHLGVPEFAMEETDLGEIIEYNMIKELSEEACLLPKDIMQIEMRYFIQSNDNKISSEHMGVISMVYIDSSKMDYELVSGEPEKHDVVKLSFMDISNLEVLDTMDTWLRKVIMKMKEDLTI